MVHIPQGYKLGIKLITPPKEIEEKALRGLAASLNRELPRLARYVQQEISLKTDQIFFSSLEFQLIINGNLRGELGMPKGEELSRMQAILNVLSQQVLVEPVNVSVSGGTFRSGGLRIMMFKNDFTDLFKLPEANITTEKGVNLPWLEWLLTAGNKILISGYDVNYGNYGSRTNKQGMAISRSGLAVMVPGQTLNWGLGSAGGTPKNNWITRAIEFSWTMGYLEEIVELSIYKWLARFGG
jgi:hypothetical protein